MTLSRLLGMLFAGLALVAGSRGAAAEAKRLLVIGEVKGFQHDSVSPPWPPCGSSARKPACGKPTSRPNTQLITRRSCPATPRTWTTLTPCSFYTTGELPLDDSQKADLISFVRDDGKGSSAHTARRHALQMARVRRDARRLLRRPPLEYLRRANHRGRPEFPATRHLPPSFVINDEIYQARNFSREKSRVLLRMDETKLDMTKKASSAPTRTSPSLVPHLRQGTSAVQRPGAP